MNANAATDLGAKNPVGVASHMLRAPDPTADPGVERDIAISSIVKGLNMTIRPARMDDAIAMQAVISTDDRYDLDHTWRRDWRAELFATLLNSTSSFRIEMPGQEGFILFGLREQDTSGQLWMVQSERFLATITSRDPAFTVAWLTAVHRVAKTYLEGVLFIYNFVPKKQKDTVRYLKQCGFVFYEREEPSIDYFLFGAGPGLPEAAGRTVFWKEHLGELIP